MQHLGSRVVFSVDTICHLVLVFYVYPILTFSGSAEVDK